MLNAETLRSLLHYERETGQFVWRVKPSQCVAAGSVAGSIGADGYSRIRIGRRHYKAHRLAWLYVNGVWPRDEIDHINGDRADNRIENLREATRSQNMQNRKRYRNNTSGYTGVGRSRDHWCARIWTNGRGVELGQFDDPRAAYEAYLAAKAKLHTFNPVPRAA